MYKQYVVKTVAAVGGSSNAKIRVSVLPGQGLAEGTKVECSRSMRSQYPLGTYFLLEGKVTSRGGGNEFLYSHFNAPYKVISSEEAEMIISQFK